VVLLPVILQLCISREYVDSVLIERAAPFALQALLPS